MPFGKNKKLSAPRPKKKKVVLIVEEPEEAFEEEESEAAAANPSSTTDTKDSVISSLAVPESPGKLLREEASQLNDNAVHDMCDMCEAEKVAQEADAELQVALRLYKLGALRSVCLRLAPGSAPLSGVVDCIPAGNLCERSAI